jgi:hypothetical protein
MERYYQIIAIKTTAPQAVVNKPSGENSPVPLFDNLVRDSKI